MFVDNRPGTTCSGNLLMRLWRWDCETAWYPLYPCTVCGCKLGWPPGANKPGVTRTVWQSRRGDDNSRRILSVSFYHNYPWFPIDISWFWTRLPPTTRLRRRSTTGSTPSTTPSPNGIPGRPDVAWRCWWSRRCWSTALCGSCSISRNRQWRPWWLTGPSPMDHIPWRCPVTRRCWHMGGRWLEGSPRGQMRCSWELHTGAITV